MPRICYPVGVNSAVPEPGFKEQVNPLNKDYSGIFSEECDNVTKNGIEMQDDHIEIYIMAI